MALKFRPSELEEDFDVLFGSQSRWEWPFWDGDLFSSALSLFFGALIASMLVPFVLSLFGLDVKLELWQYAVMALGYCLIADNYEFVKEWRHRRALIKKYIPAIEHTEAYALLLDGIQSCRRGVLEGLKGKAETRKYLIKMWKAAFVEASRVEQPFLTQGGILLDERPIVEQMKGYFEERQIAIDELNQSVAG